MDDLFEKIKLDEELIQTILEKSKYEELNKYCNNYNDKVIEQLKRNSNIDDYLWEFIKDDSQKDKKRKLLFLSLYRKIRNIEANKHENTMSNSLGYFIRDVYDDPIHFLMELIQNVDDAMMKSKKENNLLSFSFNNKGDLILEYQEEGFSIEDIIAITSIGNSKKTILKNGKNILIGEKGIGFKSVFALAYKVTISSGNFVFSLSDYKNEEIGRYKNILVPEYVNYFDEARNYTKLIIEFRRKDDTERVKERIESYFRNPEKTFLFLQAIKQIKFEEKIIGIEFGEKEYLQDKKCTIETVTINNFKCLRYNEIIEFNAMEARSRWADRNFKINDDEIVEREVSVCFPENVDELKNEEDKYEGKVFSFLPTNIIIQGIPIYINIDAHLKGSRGNIKVDDFYIESTWNKKLKEKLPHILKNAYLSLKNTKYKKKIIQYLPNLIEKSNEKFSLSEQFEKCFDCLSDEEIILLYDGETFSKISNTCIMEKHNVTYELLRYDRYREKLKENIIYEKWNEIFRDTIYYKDNKYKEKIREKKVYDIIEANLGIITDIIENNELINNVYEYLVDNSNKYNYSNNYTKLRLFPVIKEKDNKNIEFASYDEKDIFIQNSNESIEYKGIYVNYYLIEKDSLEKYANLQTLIKMCFNKKIFVYSEREIINNLFQPNSVFTIKELIQKLEKLMPYYSETMLKALSDCKNNIKIKISECSEKSISEITLNNLDDFLYIKDSNQTYLSEFLEYDTGITKLNFEVNENLNKKNVIEMLVELGLYYKPSFVNNYIDEYSKCFYKIMYRKFQEDSQFEIYRKLCEYLAEIISKLDIVRLDNDMKEIIYLKSIDGTYKKINETYFIDFSKIDINDLKMFHIYLQEPRKKYEYGIVLQYGEKMIYDKALYSINDIRKLQIGKFNSERKTSDSHTELFVYNNVAYILKIIDAKKFIHIIKAFYKIYGIYFEKYVFSIEQYYSIFDMINKRNLEFSEFYEGEKGNFIRDYDVEESGKLKVINNNDELKPLMKKICEDYGINICDIRIVPSNLLENNEYKEKCIYFKKDKKIRYYIPEEIFNLRGIIKALEQIVFFNNNQKLSRIDIDYIKDSLCLNDTITSIERLNIDKGIELELYARAHEKNIKTTGEIKLNFLTKEKFMQPYNNIMGYEYICPICGTNMSDVELSGVEIKRKFDMYNKDIRYIFCGCKNCVNLLRHSEINIVNFFEIMKEFEKYYEIDNDMDIDLKMKTIEILINIEGGKQGLRKKIKLSYYNLLIIYLENKDIIEDKMRLIIN